MTEFLTIGIIGGMSPESTVTYYQHIVRRHLAEFQEHNYPRVVIISVSFGRYIGWQHAGDWERIARGLEVEFQHLAAAGADFALLATNTMHKVLPSISSPITVLSVLDAVGDYARKRSIRTLGLTGTKFTMSDGFYAEGLESRGLSVLLPTAAEQEAIHGIIYHELIRGAVEPQSVEIFSGIARGLLSRGADAVLLGCTELELLTRGSPLGPKLVDSTRVHADAAWAMSVGRQPAPE